VLPFQKGRLDRSFRPLLRLQKADDEVIQLSWPVGLEVSFTAASLGVESIGQETVGGDIKLTLGDEKVSWCQNRRSSTPKVE
jgi:hypothetical protein